MIGGAFGLVAGIANGSISMAVPAIGVFPADGPASDPSAFAIPFVIVTSGFISVSIIADVALAVIAFRLVRRRWGTVSARRN